MPAEHNFSAENLPPPDQAALEHSRRLRDRIRARIEAHGPITFADYMQMALYEPGLGYYSAGSRKFGPGGDFITAPEISPLFSACLARQVRQILATIQNPCILEAGPGSGVMAGDIMTNLEAQGCLPDRYYLLETSAELRQRQQQYLQEKIPRLYDRLQWLDMLPAGKCNGVILANEVLDALPFRQVINNYGTWNELCVGVDADQFCRITRAADKNLQAATSSRLPAAASLPDGYITEINMMTGPWLQGFADAMGRGMILLIDYGYSRNEYYHPQRSAGSLLCHYRHHAHTDPFLYPGLQDITASVEFTTVAEAAVDASLQVSGYTTQAHFLMQNGLDEYLQDNNPQQSRERVDLNARVQQLVMPGEMGERVKFLALTRHVDLQLSGFKTFDQRRRL